MRVGKAWKKVYMLTRVEAPQMKKIEHDSGSHTDVKSLYFVSEG